MGYRMSYNIAFSHERLWCLVFCSAAFACTLPWGYPGFVPLMASFIGGFIDAGVSVVIWLNARTSTLARWAYWMLFPTMVGFMLTIYVLYLHERHPQMKFVTCMLTYGVAGLATFPYWIILMKRWRRLRRQNRT
jgi:hypothetical protein